jgi:carbon-monoxide dehydrogenase small subunit
MTAADLLKNNKKPGEEEIRVALEGNLCRCTGYENIVKSIQWAADKMSAPKARKTKKEATV